MSTRTVQIPTDPDFKNTMPAQISSDQEITTNLYPGKKFRPTMRYIAFPKSGPMQSDNMIDWHPLPAESAPRDD